MVRYTATIANGDDTKHKPELISALENFHALRGFRPLEEVGRTLRDIPELSDLAPDGTLTHDGMVALYAELMQLLQPEVNRRLSPLMQRLRAANENRAFGKADPEYWAIRTDDEFSRPDFKVRGLFSVFLLFLIPYGIPYMMSARAMATVFDGSVPS